MDRTLGLRSGALLLALTLGGCDEDPACTGDSCEDQSQKAGEDTGKSAKTPAKDAGEKGSSVKDAGTKDAGNKNLGAPVPAAAASKSLPCDVQAIVDSRCATCHSAPPKGGAPNSLVTADHFAVTAPDGKVMREVVASRISEQDPTKRMPPTGYPQLTDAEKATFKTWLDRGAPAGTEKCASRVEVVKNEPPPVIEDGDLECYKLLAHNGDGKTKLDVGIAADSYLMYIFEPPWKDTVYGIVLRPIIDNEAILHHWLLFQDAVPGPPSGPIPQVGAHPTGQLIAGWAPGAETIDFRQTKADVGFELPANTTYTVEFHYNSSDPFATDASGVEVCAVKRKPANVAGISWLGFDQWLVPSQQWTGVCRPGSKDPIHITHVWPHMHLQGRHMKATINRADGSTEILHDEDFDFNYQRAYVKDVTLMPGDTITTVCDYATPMSFGQPTDMEMCYLFTTSYPKGALSGFDVFGTFEHGGSSCLGI
jgi:hypothetical protein